MGMNSFNATIRLMKHDGVIRSLTTWGDILDPDRIVNRTIFGTDYDPKDVAFKAEWSSTGNLSFRLSNA